jgi:subtilisin family serine protease
METFILLRAPGPSSGPRERDAAGTRDKLRIERVELDRPGAAEKARDPEVAALAPDMALRLHEPTERGPGPREGGTWGLDAIGARTSPYTGAGVTVAVLDTGIDRHHPAFAGVDIVMRDFTGEGEEDRNGHGTHCCGVIFGGEIDRVRIGVAPDVHRALVGKVIGEHTATTAMLVSAIQWALDEGADVISQSLGLDFPGEVARQIARGLPAELATSRALAAYRATTDLFSALALFARRRQPVGRCPLFVAAAGNESRRDLDPDFDITVAPPASADDIVAVGALGRAEAGFALAPFSNVDPQVCGPGVGVWSAAPGGGGVLMSGTSMATPHVAGVAVQWAQALRERCGRVDPVSLAARVVGGGSMGGLGDEGPANGLGTGLVQSPPAPPARP